MFHVEREQKAGVKRVKSKIGMFAKESTDFFPKWSRFQKRILSVWRKNELAVFWKKVLMLKNPVAEKTQKARF